MVATGIAYNFWLYELCDVYIVRSSIFQYATVTYYRTSVTGSYEAHVRRLSARGNSQVSAADTVYVPRPWLTLTPSLYAFRY